MCVSVCVRAYGGGYTKVLLVALFRLHSLLSAELSIVVLSLSAQ